MEELREGQRVQLNLAQMAPHRREVYAGSGPGKVAGFRDERIWLKFDNGWSALFSPEEVEPAVEQIGMFGDKL
jgi:hypothetical protein